MKKRNSKVREDQTGSVFRSGGSFQDFISCLPRVLAAQDLMDVADAVVAARGSKRPVILGMGAHPIKVGLSPVIIDLIERGVITAIASNGASIVHDFELSYVGKTSEDVGPHLTTGTFGMAQETGQLINREINAGVRKGSGIGKAIGDFILESRDFRFTGKSIFAACSRTGIPATVHVAIGSDIIHMHPEADGASIGKGSMRDFKLLSSVVADLEGGVFLNLGSAVVIPEVFLKALTVARNLGYTVDAFTTATMDFIKQYRAMENVCKRPIMKGGRSYYITGHHEINFPLLAAVIKEKIALTDQR